MLECRGESASLCAAAAAQLREQLRPEAAQRECFWALRPQAIREEHAFNSEPTFFTRKLDMRFSVQALMGGLFVVALSTVVQAGIISDYHFSAGECWSIPGRPDTL